MRLLPLDKSMRHAPHILVMVLLSFFMGGGCTSQTDREVQTQRSDLSPEIWMEDYNRYMNDQNSARTEAEVAEGENGALTVAHNTLAARAGLEALKQGGNAMDAALTTALMQVALTAGYPVSYFGVMEMVYYEAATGKSYTMNADWNTVINEKEPLTIPQLKPKPEKGLSGLLGSVPSGRTALVGGFMKGVGAAHQRFGELPFDKLFEPAIYVAAEGIPVSADLGQAFKVRAKDLRRLPETKNTLLKPDGKPYREGEIFRQPALAKTLATIAEQGPDYMYGGPWGEKLVAAVQADGGKMTIEDLKSYQVIWDEALVAPLADYQVHTMPLPMRGGTMIIEAQNLAEVSGLADQPHWTKSSESLRKALNITQMFVLDFYPEEQIENLYPSLNRTDTVRLTHDYASRLSFRMKAGKLPFEWAEYRPNHSDAIIAADKEGNMVAMSHSINCILWGKTAIVVDGITIGDPGSLYGSRIKETGPGNRLPGPAQIGILMEDGKPVLGFGAMSNGMHHRTFQALLNFTRFGMRVDEAINTPDFFNPMRDPESGKLIIRVPEDRFSQEVLEGTGYRYLEITSKDARAHGGGTWVGISRDNKTGEYRAASNNRGNSGAVAY